MSIEPNEFVKTSVVHHLYINNAMSQFVRSVANFFRNEWYPNTTEIVISTYSKAVQHFKNRMTQAGEKYSPKYPFMSFDVGMDFEPDPQAGRFLHQYPNTSLKFGMQLSKPVIYEDDNVLVAPVWNRYKGTFEITLFNENVYDFIDMRTLTYQWWGGLQRIIHPVVVEGLIVLPDELLSYNYENRYTKDSYTLDWESNNSSTYLIKNINQNRMSFPFLIRPQLRLINIGDAADKYGGAGSEIADNNLLVQMEWETYLPTHIGVMQKEYPTFCPDNSNFIADIAVNFQYIKMNRYPSEVSSSIQSVAVPDQMFTVEIQNLEDGGETVSKFYRFDTSYNYVITQDDKNKLTADPPENFQVTLLQELESCSFVRVYWKGGLLKKDYCWRLIDSETVEFYGLNVANLDVGDVIVFAFYKEGEEE